MGEAQQMRLPSWSGLMPAKSNKEGEFKYWASKGNLQRLHHLHQ